MQWVDRFQDKDSLMIKVQNLNIWLHNERAKTAYFKRLQWLPSSPRASPGNCKLYMMLVRVKILSGMRCSLWCFHGGCFLTPIPSWLVWNLCNAASHVWQTSHAKIPRHPHECLMWDKVMLRIMSKEVPPAGPSLGCRGHLWNDSTMNGCNIVYLTIPLVFAIQVISNFCLLRCKKQIVLKPLSLFWKHLSSKIGNRFLT